MQEQTITQVPAVAIVAGLNDRTEFHAGELQRLADNIREIGLAQPPLFRRLPDGTYQIIAGERRTRAMRDILGWEQIPARVITADDETAVALMGSENRNRVQLNLLDEATSYQRNMARWGWDVATCARKMGVSTRTVNERLALLSLCFEAQDLVRIGQLTPGYALVLAQANLDTNFQRRALDTLKQEKSPTIEWWRLTVAACLQAQAQASLFDTALFGTVSQAQMPDLGAVTLPPDPETDSAPVDGATPGAVVSNQIAYWRDAAARWEVLGNKRKARACGKAAEALVPVAALLAHVAPVSAPDPTLGARVAALEAERQAAEQLLDEAQAQIAWYQQMLSTPQQAPASKRARRPRRSGPSQL